MNDHRKFNNIDILGDLGDVGQYGVKRLATYSEESINGRILLGTYLGSAELKSLVDSRVIPLDKTSEAYSFTKLSPCEYYLVGYDDKGLMYGCLEILEKLKRIQDLSQILNRTEKPFVKVRGIFTFMCNKDIGDEWFFSKKYWEDYFDMLAENKFNSFNLVFSHQTDYLAPMFAYFVKVESHPEIYATDVDEEQLKKNREMLQFITECADTRGIDFMLGIWQVRAWKVEKKDTTPRPGGHVEGIDDHNIKDYTYKALKKLLEEFEGIKGIQIRANSESGISEKMQTEFFTETFFKVLHESKRPIVFDFREWMAEKQTLENAVSMCPNIRLSVKYWAEFMGAPYQPAKTSPGYSYSDLLRQPLKNDFMWQVWSLGSPRLLLWGDPEYVKRFVNTLQLGGANGFEINPHLAQKGYGNDPGYWRIFKNKEDEYYQWEHERYWMFYTLFGRLSYNPDLPADIWLNKVIDRFGQDKAADIMDVYEKGSKVVTFLVQYTLNDPNMYVWPEIDTGGLLDLYLETPTCDPCVIYTVAQYAKDYMLGDLSGKLSPDEASNYFYDLGTSMLKKIAVLETDCSLTGPAADLEYRSTLTDFRILAQLALFHSRKILAALELACFYESGDYSSLKKCHKLLKEARNYWEQIISAAQDIYYDKMITGPLDSGDWRKKLTLVYEDELRIQELLDLHQTHGILYKGFDFGSDTRPKYDDSYKFPIYKSYAVEKGFVEVTENNRYDIHAGFGFDTSCELKSVMAAAVRLSDKHMDMISRDVHMDTGFGSYRRYGNMLYADYICGESTCTFQADVNPDEYQVTILMADRTATAKSHGPMSLTIGDISFNNIEAGPTILATRSARVQAANGQINVTFDCEKGADWFISGMTIVRLTPEIRHLPHRVIPDDGIVSATVTCPDELESVIMFIKDDRGEYNPVIMSTDDRPVYRANLLSFLEEGRHYSYYFWARSVNGREISTEIYRTLVKGQRSKFEVRHSPVENCDQGKDVDLTIKVSSKYELKAVRLYYSYVNQYSELACLDLVQEGDHFAGRIQASFINKEWDILYYFEIVDSTGKGIIYPDFKIRTPYYVIKVAR